MKEYFLSKKMGKQFLLKETDYQILKCYEAFMQEQPMPYDLEALIAQRNLWREEINECETELAALIEAENQSNSGESED
jgi:uncharacterized protein